MSATNEWRRCSACKKPIPLGSLYYVCSVSTCNRPRTGLVFCDVSCWEVHLPVARHREAWAEEMTAPRTAEPALAKGAAPDRGAALAKSAGAAKSTPSKTGESRSPRRTRVRKKEGAAPAPGGPEPAREVLIVASRLKDYVRARSGMNTSERVLGPLSEIVRQVCDEAIRNAERDGRKTVLDRDVPRRS